MTITKINDIIRETLRDVATRNINIDDIVRETLRDTATRNVNLTDLARETLRNTQQPSVHLTVLVRETLYLPVQPPKPYWHFYAPFEVEDRGEGIWHHRNRPPSPTPPIPPRAKPPIIANVPDPRYMRGWYEWSAELSMGARATHMVVDETDWRKYAQNLLAQLPFDQLQLPDPQTATSWQDWGYKLAMATGAGL